MEAHAPYQEVPLRWRRAFTRPGLSAAELERVGERSQMAQVLKEEVAPALVPDTLDLVDGATAAADAYLGEVLEALGDDVLVVALSDHGELLGEHGTWGHNLGLWEPLLRVPLVVAGPGVPRGVVRDDPVSVLDVMPTLLARAGAALPPVEGLDLGQLLAEPPTPLPDRVLRAEHFRTDFLTQGWQLLHPFGDHRAWRARRAAAVHGHTKRILGEDGTDLGLDLARDPGEERPGPGRETGLALDLPVPGQAPPAPPMDPAERERLRDLGYVR